MYSAIRPMPCDVMYRYSRKGPSLVSVEMPSHLLRWWHASCNVQALAKGHRALFLISVEQIAV